MDKLQEIQEALSKVEGDIFKESLKARSYEYITYLLQVVEERNKGLKRICNLEEPQYQSEYSSLFRLSQAIARKALGKE